MTLPSHIYVNGVQRMIVDGARGGSFFIDDEDMPGRACSCRHLDGAAWAHLERGGRVFASGSWYSLSPNRPNIPAFAPPKRTLMQRLRRWLKDRL